MKGGDVRLHRADLPAEVDHTDGHVYLDRMADLTTLTYTITL
jgi:hypothetical protein